MKVKELINQLAKFPGDMNVLIDEYACSHVTSEFWSSDDECIIEEHDIHSNTKGVRVALVHSWR